MKKRMIYWVLPILLGFTIVSCEKEAKDTDPLQATADVSAEATLVDGMTGVMSDLVNDLSKSAETTLKSASTSFPVITITPFSGTQLYPATVTVDFGTTPIEVTTENGATASVSGLIKFTKSDAFFVVGSVQEATLTSFTFNGYHIVGTITWTNKGRIGTNETWVFNRTTSLVFTSPEGWIHEQASNFDFGLVEGFEDLVAGNEVMEVTGSVTGEASTGESYNHVINSEKPVVFKAGCDWAVKGEMLLKNNTGSYIMDLGDGTCDNQATIQREDGVGGVFTFTME